VRDASNSIPQSEAAAGDMLRTHPAILSANADSQAA
jgi:hypothetical protein